VLNVDGDEAFVYPRCEEVPLKELTRRLDEEGAEALLAPMLDMYAAAPMDALAYEPGQSLIETFPTSIPTATPAATATSSRSSISTAAAARGSSTRRRPRARCCRRCR
jgi:uroporphyrinogen-III synthase